MKVHIITTDGVDERHEMPFSQIKTAIGADCLDTVNLRDGRVMLVDDNGHERGLPINQAATVLYHGVCRPGTTHQIRGDVAIVVDREVDS